MSKMTKIKMKFRFLKTVLINKNKPIYLFTHTVLWIAYGFSSLGETQFLIALVLTFVNVIFLITLWFPLTKLKNRQTPNNKKTKY